MTPRNFFLGRAIVLVILLVIGLAFFAFSKINEVDVPNTTDNDVNQPDSEPAIFTWKFEEADSLNLDGNPRTNIFLEIGYTDGETKTKLIDTSDSSCNELPDRDVDSANGSATIQCYGAGLGYLYKVTEGEDSYVVMRKKIEEASPEYDPPVYEYEVFTQLP